MHRLSTARSIVLSQFVIRCLTQRIWVGLLSSLFEPLVQFVILVDSLLDPLSIFLDPVHFY